MSGLAPVAGTPGLIADPAWQPGTPGTFAVIIGVSRYDHLDGGVAPAPDTYGLGQLHVSAATAYRLFLWLRDRYSFPTAPLAQCWLLLSPTPEEQTAIGGVDVSHVGAIPGTMDNCTAAIGAWAATMEQLPTEAAARSRAVFFFSGHGLEVRADRQVMLPSDYLAPPTFNVNEAISTEFLRNGLASSPVPHQFLFVDACRNDVPRLREMEVEGRRILNIKASAHHNRAVVAPVFYAASAGTQAYQPRELEKGYSLFGGALADGLGGAEGLELACGETECEIRVFPLHTYLKGRVAQLLSAFQVSPDEQQVRLGGSVDDLGITVLRRSEAVRGDDGGPLLTVAPALEATYTVRLDETSWRPTDPYPEGHELFGSENVTDILTGAQVYRLEDGAALTGGDVVVRHVRRSADTTAQVIGLSLPPSRFGHWLQLTDRSGGGFGCVLAGDLEASPTYEIQLDVPLVEPPGADRPITRLEARLSPRTAGPLGSVATAWETYEVHNLGRAVEGIDLGLMIETVEGKLQSPLAATVAAHLVLKARRSDLLPESWLRNLSDWFPSHPDGPVLWAESLRRQSPTGGTDDPHLAERIEHVGRLARRGLPQLAEVLAMAGSQLDELASTGTLPGPLQVIDQQIRKAMRYHRPGGLFAVFAGPPGTIGPHLVMPPMR